MRRRLASLQLLLDELRPQARPMQVGLDRPRHLLGGVSTEQLQHADVVPRPRARAQFLFQSVAQLAERRRQLQLLEQLRVIQIRRLTLQRRQESASVPAPDRPASRLRRCLATTCPLCTSTI